MDRRKTNAVTVHYDNGTVKTYTRNCVVVLKDYDGKFIYRPLPFDEKERPLIGFMLELAAWLFKRKEEDSNR